MSVLKIFKLFVIGVALGIAASFVTRYAQGSTRVYINQSFKEVAKEQGVDEKLLRAICWVESKHKSFAYAYGDGGMQNHAFGVCQVLYTTAKQFGINDENCLRDFTDFTAGERVYAACHLFGPKTNIRVAARLLKYYLKKHDGNEYQAVIAYNSGTYRVCRDGWLKANQPQEDGTLKKVRLKRCLIGGPINLYYPNKVLEAIGR